MNITCFVLARNKNGDRDIIHIPVECSIQDYNEGGHYIMAERKAKDYGFENCVAFDEREPAGKLSVMNHNHFVSLP